MSTSLNHLLSNTKARPTILIAVALLITGVAYLVVSKPSKETRIKNLTSQLREGKFEQLYEEADESVHRNVTKENFVQRLKKAVAKLKAIDENLNFQRDRDMERMIFADDETLLIRSMQTLGKDDKSVLVGFAWTNKGDFLDLYVLPMSATSEEYRVYGVSYEHLSVGGRLVE